MKKITDTFLRAIKPQAKLQKITIGEGLTLYVSPKGKKTWYLRYYLPDGSRQNVKIGDYPALSLKEATLKADQLKTRAKEEGVNLAQTLKKEAIDRLETSQGKNSFEHIATQWLDKKSLSWVPSHTKRNRERLTANIFPVFGHLPIGTVSLADIDKALQIIINRGAKETARRICTLVISIFEYADLMGYLENLDIITRLQRYRKNMPKPKREEIRHLYQEMSEPQIGKLLLAIEEHKARWTFPTSIALQLAPYVMLRPGELCNAEWAEIDFENEEWLIPSRKTKNGTDHIIPLSPQPIKLLKEIQSWSGQRQFVFSSSRQKGPIGTFTLVQALRRMGYGSITSNSENSFTTHGFRGLASTILHQILKFPSDYIELQLNHIEQNKVKAAYNRITPRSFLAERREMLITYADYLDTLRDMAK